MILLNPYLHYTLIQNIVKTFNIGSYPQRIKLGAVDRPWYGHCIYNAAVLAKKLKYDRISVIEFGVAGGKGLLNLEYHAKETEKATGVGIDIYGFDTAKGLPKPKGYWDLPYCWQEGQFNDINQIKVLNRSRLIIGDVKDTVDTFLYEHKPAPIGAMLFDLDYYSSTTNALHLLYFNPYYFLPRLFCYFDNIMGNELILHSKYTGERLAINEFNKSHHDIKFDMAYYLFKRKVIEHWFHKIRICHIFNHKKYDTFIK